MDDAFLKSAEKYLKEAAGGRGQKQAAYHAAQEVASAPGDVGAMVRQTFWAWLTSGRWLEPVYSPSVYLADESPLNEDKIRENYSDGYRFDFKKAEARAIAAYDRRVRRAREHRDAGWPEAEWVTFLYSKPEAKEVRGKEAAA